MKILKLTILLILLALPVGVRAADVWFNPTGSNTSPYDTEAKGATSLQTAVNAGSAGDDIIVQDGTHDDLGLITCPDTDGSSGNEITIRPETEGAVTFTGKFWLKVYGDYWIIQDFIFDGMEPDDSTDRVRIIYLYGAHDRVTDCKFTNSVNTVGTFDYCILITDGDNARIDHNYFYNLYAKGIVVEQGTTDVQIDYNHFYNFPEANGNSAIHVGDVEAYMDQDLSTIVEYNRFVLCQGDTETISNKSSSNTYRYNVFRNSRALNLRYGQDCVVDSNYFFGIPLYNCDGLYVSDAGHIIKNNYFEGLSALRGLYLHGGTVNTRGVSGYTAATNCLVIYNTFANSSTSRTVQIGSGSTYDVDTITFQNNIFEGATEASSLIRAFSDVNEAGLTWTKNVVHQKNQGSPVYWQGFDDDPADQLEGDPTFTTRTNTEYDDLYILPAAGGTATNAGTANVSYDEDFDGDDRDDATPDVGCDEYSASTPSRNPVGESDVGPSWAQPQDPGEVQGYPDIIGWLNAEGTWATPTYTIGNSEYFPDDSTGTVASAADITASPKYGTNSFSIPGADDYFQFDFDEVPAVVGLWVDFDTAADDGKLWEIENDAGDERVYLRLDTTDELKLTYDDGTNILVADTANDSPNSPFPAAECDGDADWHWVECLIDEDNNQIYIYIDGTEYAYDTDTMDGFTPTRLRLGNDFGSAIAYKMDNFVMSNDTTRVFWSDEHNGVDFADLTAYPAGGASMTAFSITPGTYVAGQQITATATWSGEITEDNSGGFPKVPVKLAPLWGSILFTATSSTNWVSEVITDGMRSNGALEFAVNEIQMPSGSAWTSGGININLDVSELSITGSPEVFDPRDANSPIIVNSTEDADASTISGAETIFGCLGPLDWVVVQSSENYIATAAGVLFRVLSIGNFDCDNLAITIYGTNRISGTLSNSGSATLYPYNPPMISN